MKQFFVSFFTVLLIIFFSTTGWSQSVDLPDFDEAALVSTVSRGSTAKPYTVLVYGAIGCGYSRFLIDNLDQLTQCADNAEVLVLLDNTKEEIGQHMSGHLDSLVIFSNAVLEHRFKKKNGHYPQVFVYHQGKAIMHIMGVKKGMLTRIREQIECDQ
jgi:hypothetical protein